MEKAAKDLELISRYFPRLTTLQLQQIESLSELYSEWNSRVNVISRKDIENLYEKHVLHSLSIAAVCQWPAGMEIMDLGTGGGFPGIPLAIIFPEVQFHLVDSIGKKLKVVNEVVKGLGLQNVTARHSRIEEIKNRRFDAVVSRAVAPLKELLDWSYPLLKKKPVENNVVDSPGKMTIDAQSPVTGLICLKGGDLVQEIIASNSSPKMIEIYDLFPEKYFEKKYILIID